MNSPLHEKDASMHSGQSERRQVLVTGGTSGIGEAIASAFARLGDQVSATGRTADEVAAARATHPDIEFLELDVSNAADIAQLASRWEQVDVLVNCAGMILRERREFDPVEFARVVDVNLTGTMRVCTALRPLLARRRGSIVNIASMLSFFGSGHAPGYSASKGGIAQLTKSLAIAWAPEGIRVNGLAPGWIRTPLTKPLYDDAARSAPILARTPLGRWGEPGDVAGAAVFLASTAAAFITGVILPVDGGYLIA